MKSFKTRLILFFLVLLLAGIQPMAVSAHFHNDVLKYTETYYGGEITEQKWRFCIIPFGIFPIPVPFRYIEVTLANPLLGDREWKLYYVYLLSRTLSRERREETSAVLGTFLPQADDAFRSPCANRGKLPQADGVIFKIGTGCKTGETPGQGKCKLSQIEEDF